MENIKLRGKKIGSRNFKAKYVYQLATANKECRYQTNVFHCLTRDKP